MFFSRVSQYHTVGQQFGNFVLNTSEFNLQSGTFAFVVMASAVFGAGLYATLLRFRKSKSPAELVVFVSGLFALAGAALAIAGRDFGTILLAIGAGANVIKGTCQWWLKRKYNRRQIAEDTSVP